MRAFVLATLLGLGSAFAVTGVAPPAHADFDPGGRRKPGKPPAKPGAAPRPAQPKPGQPKPAQPKPPQPGQPKPPSPDAPGRDADAGRSPDALITRYSAIVLAQPAAGFPLQRLAQLYRERDGNLKKLVEDFERRAAATGDEAWAARVALAGIYKIEGRADDAIRTYEAAIGERPKESAPLLALAQLEIDRGNQTSARGHFEKALPLLTVAADVEQTRRTLMQLCLDLKDFDAARKHHAELVKRAQGSLFVKAELGRELLARNHLELAEVELREMVKAASGDNRALAPALRDLGRVLARAKKTSEALEVLRRALAVAGGAAGVRAEVLAVMTEAYRAEGRLLELVEILEKEPGQDFQRLVTLGAVHEETGNVDKALATYRKALAIDRSHVDTRVKVVHLLQTAGELEAAIAEYEALIKAAPRNPEFVFELCETLIQRGDRPKALRLLKELEGRSGGEGDVLAAVADFYERVEEKDRALAVLQKLANAQTGDPTFLVDLGDRYYQAGDKKRALETWAKIRALVPNRARASFSLGEVYLDHDMPDEALAALREAVSLEPANLQFKKALAVALERTAPGTPQAQARFAESVALWEELLKGAKNDANLAREARTHMVGIWSISKELTARVSPLTARFEATPPDLEAGRLLAEVHRKLGKLAEAATTLRAVVARAPGDEGSLLALERVLVQQRDLAGAIGVLEKLAELNPKAARQYYQRMAQYAAELYRDDDAIRYAAKAVELSPEDANGHQKLGDMYRKRQDVPKAIAEYRQAIAKNDRLFPVYFDLAELLLSTGEVADADRLFRRVVRASGDEELVARAARMSMQVNLGKGTLEVLEKELLPVAVGNPQKPLYRRLLVELYGAMTLPLVQKVRHAENPADVAAARAQLSAIGARAVKPLLDALGDDRESQQRVAIEVLAYVENKNAGPSLFAFATSQADKDLRTRAMVAVGALGDPALLPRLGELLAPEGRAGAAAADEVAVAAAWAVARTDDAKAHALLLRLLASASPDVRTVAAVGLGLAGHKAAGGKHVPALVALARSPEAGPRARGAALLALGRLVEAGAPEPEALDGLVATFLGSPDTSLRSAALTTSAFVARDGAAARADADEALASAVFARDPALVRDAVAAAAYAGGAPPRTRTGLPVPDGPLELESIVRGLAPAAPDGAARAEALVRLAPALVRAATSATAASPERAAVVGDALSSAVLGPFRPELALDAALRARAEKATQELAVAVTPAFTPLLTHPDVTLRTRAATVLARAATKDALAALTHALEGADEEARRAVLVAVSATRAVGLVDAVARVARTGPSWPLRVRAIETLGEIGAGSQAASAALAAIAKEDEFSLVREASLRALHAVDPGAAAAVLREASAKDDEPRVRATAAALLGAR